MEMHQQIPNTLNQSELRAKDPSCVGDKFSEVLSQAPVVDAGKRNKSFSQHETSKNISADLVSLKLSSLESKMNNL